MITASATDRHVEVREANVGIGVQTSTQVTTLQPPVSGNVQECCNAVMRVHALTKGNQLHYSVIRDIYSDGKHMRASTVKIE